MSVKRYAVAVDGAGIPGGAYDQTITVRCKPEAEANAILHCDDIVDAVGRPLRTYEEDWLDLLRAIHIADLVCHRGENEEWDRHVVLALPLRDPSRVQSYLPLIQEIFGRMTHDVLDISVERDTEPPPERYPRQRLTSKIDSVALLSGGLDSAATAMSLLEQHTNPILVSCATSPHVIRAQKAVIEALSAKYSCTAKTAKFKVELKHKHSTMPLPEYDVSQRSRTLLFTGVASVIAAAHGIDTVTLGENGVMAINCPLTTGRAAGFSTHTAYPDVLPLMSRLFSDVLNRQQRVHNPLSGKTKTEVVKDLLRAGLGDVIPRTHSCWIARKPEHCGVCVPCVVRRVATEAAGATDVKYSHDSFANPAPPGDTNFNAIGDYLMFARKIDSSSDDDLLLDYMELNVEGGTPAHDAIIETHRRWSRDVLSVGRSHSALQAYL